MTRLTNTLLPWLKDGDGLYDGIVGDLQMGWSDLGYSQLFIKYDRTFLMDFSIPYDLDHNCFLTKKPEELPKILALVMPFTVPGSQKCLVVTTDLNDFKLDPPSLDCHGCPDSPDHCTHDAVAMVW